MTAISTGENSSTVLVTPQGALGGGGGGGRGIAIPGRKYIEGTDSRPHAYNTLIYIEGDPYKKCAVKKTTTNVYLKMYTIHIYNNVTIKSGLIPPSWLGN